MKQTLTIIAAVIVTLSATAQQFDLCVYGGTSAGVVAAYSAAQLDMKVALVCPEERIGGLTTGGLGQTDIGNKQVVQGIAKQFYRTLGSHYGTLESWVFEPSVALRIMEGYASHKNITLYKGEHLDRVEKSDNRIIGAHFAGRVPKLKIEADCFIDATYEGDLMAAAGVSYTVGREDNSVYGETWSGEYFHKRNHQFPDGVDPYVEKGNPASGLLPHIHDIPLKGTGKGDNLVQTYNFRICLTDNPENMVPITKPDNYDPWQYELLIRLIEAQPDKRKLANYFIWSHMPNRKTDVNNRGAFSTDYIGGSWNYPEASREERAKIFKAHEDYTKGLLYFIGHDERVPESIRREMLRWGYPKDEYVENNHFTPQLYVREARRMVGEYVCTQKDCDHKVTVEDGVAYAAYAMDSHNCKRVVVEKNGVKMLKNEGNVEMKTAGPYPISYRAITPKRAECDNLLVPVCLSASHIAFGSIRMEPVFMVLGQAAAIAAKLAKGGAVQDVDSRQIVSLMERNPYLDGSTPDILIDDNSEYVSLGDGWQRKRGNMGFGLTYLIRLAGTDESSITYTLPKGIKGKWELYSYQRMKGKVNKQVHFDVQVDKQRLEKDIDLRKIKLIGQVSGEWISLGQYDFKPRSKGRVTITMPESKLHSYADGLLLVKRE
ncbi:MAG: FAD-dependent oxidoreductase [Alistipes sp.]|nr:FAD-dependent oxidoreductase [Alistipes sp.]